MTERQWTDVYAPLVSVVSPFLWGLVGWVLDYRPTRDDWIMMACAAAVFSFDAFWWGYTKGKARAAAPPRQDV
jgi:hypothetical protein